MKIVSTFKNFHFVKRMKTKNIKNIIKMTSYLVLIINDFFKKNNLQKSLIFCFFYFENAQTQVVYDKLL